MVTLSSEANEASDFDSVEAPLRPLDFWGLDFDASSFIVVSGGSLEVLPFMVRPLNAFLDRDFDKPDLEGTFLYMWAGRELELLECLVCSLKAFLLRDVDKNGEQPSRAWNFDCPALRFAAAPHCDREPLRAVTVHLELLRRLLCLRFLPRDLNLFRE